MRRFRCAHSTPPHSFRKVASISRHCHAVRLLTKDGWAFDNLDTDWEGFRRRHGLSKGTITDLKKLSREGEVDLDELSEESVNEMLEVKALRSTIKVSL